ncbi:hypothetical protein F511_17449 [Dorcoceras hygrometricum]|uniref:Uncharacterized protein n=1 Tax=Dorcoceras hygrometricum TaxID=472368 RepID=A0A2Z7CCU8_9LAMI|nr:hypothetical protein F511_17449 [Dorcoceras hygrometricum]
MKKSAGALSVDDISNDVIIQQEATIQQEDVALLFQQTKLQWIQSQRKDLQSQCFEHPDGRRISSEAVDNLRRIIKDECQLLGVIQMAKATEACKRKGRKYCSSAVSHTAAAVVHLWSLGVLTAAGCGIGSVHAVVRSNLLVEPSEVEEGEM